MNNLIKPYDLGKNNIVESFPAIDINKIVRKAKEMYKIVLVEAQIEALGVKVGICTTNTQFTGKRLWLMCPQCQKRKGKLYSPSGLVACRQCCNLKYRKQRYKNMCESQPG